MERQRHWRWIALASVLGGIALGAAWWGFRKVDATSSAIYVSDSPDGKYRCAVFCRDVPLGGHPEYSAGLFQGRWPRRELPGRRAEWNYDSLSSSGFRATWHPTEVEIDFSTGNGDDRARVSGRDVSGSQRWERQ